MRAFLFLFLPLVSLAQATGFMADYFTSKQLEATLVVESLDGQIRHVWNEPRSQEGFLPASTFKIPNTLIILQEKLLRDEQELVKWDGVVRHSADWDRDQTLASAFATSCVWFYQAQARRVGDPLYRHYLQRLDYGNHQTGPELSSFWLDGDLRISANGQIAFLRKLVGETLPFDPEAFRILKRIMVVETGPEYVLRAKTGWAVRPSTQIGWYVGYLEAKGRTWLFACNMHLRDASQLPLRKESVLTALRRLELMP